MNVQKPISASAETCWRSTSLSDAAMLVRRELVTKLLARKTPPKVAAVFVARVLTRDMYLLTTHNAMDTTAALLGVESAQVRLFGVRRQTTRDFDSRCIAQIRSAVYKARLQLGKWRPSPW